jgi:hypothetical protein
MRVRTFASFIPVAAILAVCAVTARATGAPTLNTILTNDLTGTGGGALSECIADGGGFGWPIVAHAVGVRADFSVACSAVDSTGTTVSAPCSGGVFHMARLAKNNRDFCSSAGAWWTSQAWCEGTVRITTGHLMCRDVFFRGFSWGTN